MSHKATGRIIAAGILGIVLAWTVHNDRVKHSILGREKFIEAQAARYDRYIAKPDPVAGEVLVCLFASGMLFTAYELIALGVLRVLDIVSPDNSKS